MSKNDSVHDLRKSLDTAHTATFAAEEKFRLLVESVTDYGIFLMDPEGHIQSWNPGAERIKGYSAQEIIGRHFSIFYTQPDLQRNHPAEVLKLAVKNGKYQEEGWRLRKNGTRFWANIVITPLKGPGGQLLGFAKVTRDLTEKKEYEERLRESEERARKMFEGVKDYAMIMLDPKGHIVSWNEGARRIKGYEADEIIGKYFSIFYPETDVQMGKCEYELEEAALTGRFEDEGWRVRKDGTKFWANVLITAIRGDSGEIIGFSKLTKDITDKKRADDLLRMAHANLEKRIVERTRELTVTNDKLKEAIFVRDEFLSIASHELRTPLTPLKLQIQSLTHALKNNNITEFSAERIRKITESCDKSIIRLTALIDNLLDVSRINMGKLVLHFEHIDLVEVTSDIIERHRHEIDQCGSEVILNSQGPVMGQFDRIRMEQVISNILSNSLKYGMKRPVTISVSSDEIYAKIVLQDNGIGIAQKDYARIFERFEQASPDSRFGGLGLGLFITKQIVEAHGGLISVDSKIGEGSTFTVKIPLSGKKL